MIPNSPRSLLVIRTEGPRTDIQNMSLSPVGACPGDEAGRVNQGGCTRMQAAKLEAQKQDKEQVVSTIKATDVKQMWRDDLAAFLQAYGADPAAPVAGRHFV